MIDNEVRHLFLSGGVVVDFWIGSALGFLFGVYARRLRAVLRHVYWHWRIGICWWYKPAAQREVRDGTSSVFCLRCGQPGGYHSFDPQ